MKNSARDSFIPSHLFAPFCLCLLVVTAACTSSDGGGGTPGVTVDTTTLGSFLESGSASATVVLEAAPAGTVGVTVTSGDETVATVSADGCATGAAGHTFIADADTWATPRTVSLCGVDNATYGGGVALEVTLAISVADTTDPDYADLEIPGATLNVIDDEILYVVPGGAGAMDGSSWANALDSIQDAVDLADDLNEGVWVAAGTYRGAVSTDPVVAMADGVPIFGGFNGDEEIIANRPHPLALSILSADLGDDDDQGNFGDNNEVVVAAATDGRLDGFVVAAGRGGSSYGDGGGISGFGTSGLTLANLVIVGNDTLDSGGGLWLLDETPGNLQGLLVQNVAFIENTSSNDGGGAYLWDASGTLTNVTFSGNQADSAGGGLFSTLGDVVLSNAGFNENQAFDGDGGGAFFSEGTALISNVSFTDNFANGNGGGVSVDEGDFLLTHLSWYLNGADSGSGFAIGPSNGAEIINSAAFGNDSTDDFYSGEGSYSVDYTCNQEGYSSGTGNVDLSVASTPFATVPASGELYLLQNSPCVNAGDNTTADAALPDWAAMTTAADGTLDTGTVDMGRHYDPNHPVVLTFENNGNYLTWSTAGAQTCHLIAVFYTEGVTILEGVPPQENSTNFPAVYSHYYYLVCYGADDLNGVGQHTVARLAYVN